MKQLFSLLIDNGRYFAAFSYVPKVDDSITIESEPEKIRLFEQLYTGLKGQSPKNLMSSIESELSKALNLDSFSKAKLKLSELCGEYKNKKSLSGLPVVVEYLQSVNYAGVLSAQETFVYDLYLNKDSEIDVNELSLEQVRALARHLHKLGKFERAIDSLIPIENNEKLQLWDYHQLGLSYECLGDTEKSLYYYSLFFEKSLDKSVEQAIIEGMSKILANRKQHIASHEELEQLLSTFPKEYLLDIKVSPKIAEIKRIISFQKQWKDATTKTVKVSGYQHLSNFELEELFNKLKTKVSLHPNYADYYELSKVSAMLGKTQSSKEFLRKSLNLNCFLLVAI